MKCCTWIVVFLFSRAALGALTIDSDTSIDYAIEQDVSLVGSISVDILDGARVEGRVRVTDGSDPFGGDTTLRVLGGKLKSGVEGGTGGGWGLQLIVNGGEIEGYVDLGDGGDLTMSGGEIRGMVELGVAMPGRVSLSGGKIAGDLHLQDGDADIAGGQVVGNVRVFDGELKMSGGSIQGDVLTDGFSGIDISGGTVRGDVEWVGTVGTITGGNISGNLLVHDDGQRLSLRGGEIDGSLIVSDGGRIDIYGYGLAFATAPLLGDVLVGTLQDGRALGVGLPYSLAGDGQIRLHNLPGAPPPVPEPSVSFRRGHINDDDTVDISDAVFTLVWLFAGGSAPGCLDAADVDDTGSIDITDPVYLLNHLFLGGSPPREPYEECSSDPTSDPLGCEGPPIACGGA